MSIVKSYSVGSGDMACIRHNSDNFTIIDCNVTEETVNEMVIDLKSLSSDKGITRFISTHPDQDHIGGIELLDDKLPIVNFYVVANDANKDVVTESFKHYCSLRDGPKAFEIYKGRERRWMNQSNEARKTAGINVLWPLRSNDDFKDALDAAERGVSFNNMSAVVRYSVQGGASTLWLGDLETDFMEAIIDDITLSKTTIVFAPHHGRRSGKLPDSWLEKLDPQIVIIGEAPSRHLHYYTGYQTITQNRAWDITMDLRNKKVDFYSSNPDYKTTAQLEDEGRSRFEGYFGTLTVETDYTLDAISPQSQ